MTSLDRRAMAIGSLMLALGACGPDEDGPGGGTDPTSEAGLVERSMECLPEADAQRGITFDAMRRLSRDELALTLQDLLGPELYASAEIEPRVMGLPSDQILVPGDFSFSPPVGLAGVLNQVADHVATVAATDAQWRADQVHPCADTIPLPDDCMADVIESFGARVWRRPLTSEEIEDYSTFVSDYDDPERGLELLLRRFLQGPSLVFHIEDGVGDADNGRLRLSDYEVASRISYLTTGGPPDDALYEAAERGDLATLDGVRAQIDRLFDDPESRDRVLDFFRFYTHLVPGSDPADRLAIYNGVDPEGLGQAIHDEAFAFFDELVYGGGTYVDLMTSTVAHPSTPAMAAAFGATDPGTVDAPDHPGLLHRPALLTSYGDRTSPILRGAHLRKLFLCDDLGLPDPVAVEEAQQELGDTSAMPNREAVAALTSGASCVGCHALVNPLGFAFEGYDQIGFPRAEEVLLDEEGRVQSRYAIDTTVDNLYVGTSRVGVDDSKELVGLLAHSIQARQCLSRRLFEYYHRAALDRELDSCTVVDVDDQARDGTLREAIVAAIGNSDIFWKEDPR